MKNQDLFNEDNRATYSPEDDKLRLYVGRVPREEYEALRAEGWTSTPKQDCDFVSTWTADREDTAISYAGIVEDEDMGPADRAADRAERFSGYLDKRLAEATGHADRFDAGPSVHGFQSMAKAARSADRHDRIAERAVNAWDKAEYWQRRTAGVISNALYKSAPGVRMGRIKTLEAELRKAEKTEEEWKAKYLMVSKWQADMEGSIARIMSRYSRDRDSAETLLVDEMFGFGKVINPKDLSAPKAYLFEHRKLENPPTVQDYADHFMKVHVDPNSEEYQQSKLARYSNHLRLRIAYENQMLAEQGGRAASLDMVKGGLLGGKVIAKVNKSPKTDRVVSVAVLGPKAERGTYQAANVPGTEYALYTIETERLAPSAYSEPTEESLATLQAFEKASKAHKAKRKEENPCPLINPTLEDAERLQALINQRTTEAAAKQYNKPEVKEVLKLTQAEYAANSKGSYARLGTHGFCNGGFPYTEEGWKRERKYGRAICMIRSGGVWVKQIVHITDKPCKPLPEAIWQTEPVEA